MTHLVQLQNGSQRRVAMVDESRLRVLSNFHSVYALAQSAIAGGGSLSQLVNKHLTDESLDYNSVYSGSSEWKLLPPIDHPDEPARCLVAGTGLTHLGSAKDRESMHQKAADEASMTDSMKMFRWGVEGGKPKPGVAGISPEWFYKGTGTILRAHGEPLDVPPFGEDGGEEAEIAGVYIVGKDSRPYRVGMAIGNEFSDHRFEKKNYLNLAGSKLRTCSLGPELVIAPQFESVRGQAAIERAGKMIWSKPIQTGEAEMCHSLANIEHHHFKFDAHRRAGDVHVHFFGAHSLSFGDGIELQDGDVMQVSFEGYGRPLRNPLRRFKPSSVPMTVQPLL